jgi:hypothetical protein
VEKAISSVGANLKISERLVLRERTFVYFLHSNFRAASYTQAISTGQPKVNERLAGPHTNTHVLFSCEHLCCPHVSVQPENLKILKMFQLFIVTQSPINLLTKIPKPS